MQFITPRFSHLKLSKLGLGTMMWGDQVDETEANRQMDWALTNDVTFWDTAEFYTIPPRAETQGDTERFIGRYFAANAGARAQVTLATKVTARGNRTCDWLRGGNHVADRDNIMQAIDSSLERLQTDHVELYQVHWPDRGVNTFSQRYYKYKPELEDTPIEETLTVLSDLVKQGMAKHIGISNETPWGTMRWLQLAREMNLERIVTIQNPYSLLNRQFEIGLAEIVQREGLSLIAYSVLAMGVLSGKYLDGDVPEGSRRALWPEYASRYQNSNADAAAREYVDLARDHGLSPVQMAIAYYLTKPFIGSVLIAGTSVAQLEENLAAQNLMLGEEIINEIERIGEKYPDSCT